jgi:hypothetical protein
VREERQEGTQGKKKRGEGEVFPHEIPAEEWPKWEVEDKAEPEKTPKSGALGLLSVEKSQKVRILPSRMVRRYKPGDQPGAPRAFKSRFCIRGDRDPDAITCPGFLQPSPLPTCKFSSRPQQTEVLKDGLETSKQPLHKVVHLSVKEDPYTAGHVMEVCQAYTQTKFVRWLWGVTVSPMHL